MQHLLCLSRRALTGRRVPRPQLRRLPGASHSYATAPGRSTGTTAIPPAAWAAATAAATFGAGLYVGRARDEQPRLRPVAYADEQTMLQAAHEIQAALGHEDAVSFDHDDIERHGWSDWSSSNTTGRPVAIVYPTSTEDVSRVASICSRYSVPMIPYGAGSSIEGNFSSPYSGIVLDFVHMDRIVAFHAQDMDVVVQPGVNWVNLNKVIGAEGLFLPLDPSPTATVGGMVSTNCSGTNAFRYGTMKDWVINVTAVLADGQVIKTRRRPRKTSAGYNLTSLFVGAEGTLGLITEVTLKLAVVPAETGVAVVSFPTIAAATAAAAAVIRSGIQVAAMELMDDVQMRIVNRHGSEAVRRTRWDETATLFLRFAGSSRASIQSDIALVHQILSPHNPTNLHFAKSKQDEADLWAARKEALLTMIGIKPEGHAIWSTDVAVPISHLADIIELSKQDGERLGFFASVVGHVGDGNFHEALMYDPENAAHRKAIREAVHRMIDRALAMDGTVSGEHAIGLGKMQCLLDELGEDTIDAMKLLKQAWDPKWLLNPGKVFDLPRNSTAVAAERVERV